MTGYTINNLLNDDLVRIILNTYKWLLVHKGMLFCRVKYLNQQISIGFIASRQGQFLSVNNQHLFTSVLAGTRYPRQTTGWILISQWHYYCGAPCNLHKLIKLFVQHVFTIAEFHKDFYGSTYNPQQVGAWGGWVSGGGPSA